MFDTKRVLTFVAGALVAGLVLGSVASAFAANATTPTTPVQAVAACGLGLGNTMRSAGGRLLDVVAKLTGQTTAQVQAERATGKTFTQIAADKNISAATVVDEALQVRQAVLAEQVKSGAITQAQADAALATMKTRLTQRVSDPSACAGGGAGGGAAGGAGCGMGRGGAGGGAGRGAGCGGSCGANQ